MNEIPRAGLDVFAGAGKESVPRLLEGMNPYPLKSCRLVLATLTLSTEGRTLYARGSFAAEGDAECDRCAEPFSIRLEREFTTVLVPRDAAPDGPMNLELTEDDLDVAFYDGIGIEVADIFWEQVAVALPLKLMCRDDCRGVCPKCGANRNTERCDCTEEAAPGLFDALKVLLDKDKKE